MTEDEAKKKWCPLVNVNGSNVNIDSPIKGNPIPIFRPPCIASQCMMWRWIKEPATITSSGDGCCGLARK